jgi:CDP-diacylglycerol--glycerol-3-phosphate 3-phosphatidyltransferase
MMIDAVFSAVFAAALLALVACYGRRLSRGGAFRHARVDKAGGSPLLAKGVMEMGYWAMRPIGQVCVALGISANTISWASLVLAAGAGLALAMGSFGVGAVLGAVSAACDALDGMVARDTGTASSSGEVLDATIDRYAELLFLGGIAFHERLDPFAMVVALTAMAGAIMVSYSTAKAEALGVEPPKGAMRRQERAVYLILGTALVPVSVLLTRRFNLPPWAARLPLYAALALVGLVGNVSAIRRLRAVAEALRLPQRRELHGCAEVIARDAHAAAGDALR